MKVSFTSATGRILLHMRFPVALTKAHGRNKLLVFLFLSIRAFKYLYYAVQGGGMEINMKNEENLKYGIKTVSYVLIVALFFAIGYNTGKINGRRAAEKLIAEKAEEASVTSVTEETAEYKTDKADYTVAVKNGRIVVTDNSDNAREIASGTICEEIYPASDIEELREGLQFEDKKQAMEMFENFVS